MRTAVNFHRSCNVVISGARKSGTTASSFSKLSTLKQGLLDKKRDTCNYPPKNSFSFPRNVEPANIISSVMTSQVRTAYSYTPPPPTSKTDLSGKIQSVFHERSKAFHEISKKDSNEIEQITFKLVTSINEVRPEWVERFLQTKQTFSELKTSPNKTDFDELTTFVRHSGISPDDPDTFYLTHGVNDVEKEILKSIFRENKNMANEYIEWIKESLDKARQEIHKIKGLDQQLAYLCLEKALINQVKDKLPTHVALLSKLATIIGINQFYDDGNWVVGKVSEDSVMLSSGYTFNYSLGGSYRYATLPELKDLPSADFGKQAVIENALITWISGMLSLPTELGYHHCIALWGGGHTAVDIGATQLRAYAYQKYLNMSGHPDKPQLSKKEFYEKVPFVGLSDGFSGRSGQGAMATATSDIGKGKVGPRTTSKNPYLTIDEAKEYSRKTGIPISCFIGWIEYPQHERGDVMDDEKMNPLINFLIDHGCCKLIDAVQSHKGHTPNYLESLAHMLDGTLFFENAVWAFSKDLTKGAKAGFTLCPESMRVQDAVSSLSNTAGVNAFESPAASVLNRKNVGFNTWLAHFKVIKKMNDVVNQHKHEGLIVQLKKSNATEFNPDFKLECIDMRFGMMTNMFLSHPKIEQFLTRGNPAQRIGIMRYIQTISATDNADKFDILARFLHKEFNKLQPDDKTNEPSGFDVQALVDRFFIDQANTAK